MKVLIEIDEKTYNDVQNGKIYSSSRDVPQESVSAIKNGTPIPDNATNLEVSKALFPNTKIIKHWLGDGAIYVDMDFAEALYKAERDKDNELANPFGDHSTIFGG